MKYQYKTINTKTLDGIKKAERLHQSEEWKQISVGFYLITYERKGINKCT